MKEQLCLFFVMVGLSLVGAGCGGGGGDDDDAGAGGATVTAPSLLAGKALRLFDSSGRETRIEFASNGDAYAESGSGLEESTRSGSYTYAPTGPSATLTLRDSSTEEIRTVQLTFSSPEAGSFQSASTLGVNSNGQFSLIDSLAPPNGGTNGEPNPPPGNSPPPDQGGGTQQPIGEGGLDGRIIRMTRSTGQTHTYTFTGNQFVDSDPPEQGRGTYSFSRSGPQAALILNYTGSTGPVNLAGDRHDLQLTFVSELQGSYTSTYTVSDGTILSQDGVFEVIQ